MPVGIVTAGIGGLAEAGFGAALTSALGPVLAGALIGAGSGAAGSAIFGKDPGKGALYGGLTGGALGAVGPIAGELGISAGTAGYDLLSLGLGAAGGAAGAAVTGGNVGLSALTGGAAGGLQGILTPAASGGTSSVLNTPAGADSPSGGAPSPGGAAGAGVGAGTGLNLSPPADILAGASAASPIEGLTITGSPINTGGFNAAGSLAGTSLIGQTGTSGPTAPDKATASADDKLGTTHEKSLGSKALDFVGDHPLATAGALGLGYELLTKPKLPTTSATSGSLNNIAGQLNVQGSQLEQFINNGTLPPGAKASVDSAARAAKATLRSRFAAMGLSGSTAEASSLAQVDQQVATQTFDIANNLLQTGIKESGLSADIYTQLLKNGLAADENVSSAIANFAAAIAGGGQKKAAA